MDETVIKIYFSNSSIKFGLAVVNLTESSIETNTSVSEKTSSNFHTLGNNKQGGEGVECRNRGTLDRPDLI